MKYSICIILSLAASLSLGGVAWAEGTSASPVGYWKTIDDKTGKARGIVRIVEVSGELRGRIEKLLVFPEGDSNPTCRKCTGEKKNKPIRGLEFLWGFKREAKGWSDGYVLDPEEGRVYHGSIQVIDGGKRLKLFGYVQFVFKIGRSQVWERVSSNECAAGPPAHQLHWQIAWHNANPQIDCVRSVRAFSDCASHGPTYKPSAAQALPMHTAWTSSATEQK